MYKLLFLVLLGLSNLAFASGSLEKTSTLTADKAAEYIVDTSLMHLIDFSKKNPNAKKKELVQLIRTQFVPFINVNFSASQTLKKQWNTLSKAQQDALGEYIINSLIKDYSTFLVSYKELENIKIAANPNIKQQNNKAIVALSITTSGGESVELAVKMIRDINAQHWQLYDIVVFGVSLIKNYEQQFNSYIKRKGFEQFSKRFLN